MQQKTYQADRQTTSLLDIKFWSNLVVIALLVVINAVNFQRAASGGDALVQLASPEIIAIASALLVVWLAVGCFTAMRTKTRLKRVFIRLTETGATGVSMPEPMSNKNGIAFDIAYADITEVRIAEVRITSKNTASSLRIVCSGHEYDIPAPERLQELMETISDEIGKPQ